MAKKLFLEKNIKILKNKCDKTKGGIWLILEHITHFTAAKELSLEEAEAYTYILFKMLEEVGKS